MTESCRTCYFFRFLDLPESPLQQETGVLTPQPQNGVCRKYAPKAQLAGMAQDRLGRPSPIVVTMWPEVESKAWCGEYRPVEPGLRQ